MATIGATYLDLIDVAKRTGNNNQIDQVIEMLTELNGILDDAVAVPCNQITKHKHTIRTGLPSVAWGKLYQGIAQSKSQTAQVEDVTGFVEGLSTVDERLLEISGNEAALRLSEAVSYIESMNKEVAATIFYGDQTTATDEFTGFHPRFNDLSAANGNQIIDAGGTGSDNTSIWMVTWGDNACQMLYPSTTVAGLQREDMGRQRVLDGNSNPYYVKEEKFTWHVGLAVKDWRFVSRVANIDVSNMQAGSVDLYKFLRQAYYKHYGRRVGQQSLSSPSNTAMGRTAIYCNADVLEALDALATNQGSSDNYVRLRPVEIQGKEVMTYRGIPIRECDAILNTEAQIT